MTGRRIEQLVADGVIERVQIRGGVRFELQPTIQRYLRYLSNKAYGRDRSAVEAQLKEQKLRAEVALKESQGDCAKQKEAEAPAAPLLLHDIIIPHPFVLFRTFFRKVNICISRMSMRNEMAKFI